ncbi:hypothetical protein QCA50_017376 [Cerrena zonata]|uniref:Uncharacterized protein n=1 Tax=Cerrena zonata TaxID=2478898 RepID=A0AAW0FJE7_9APHY
MMPLWLVTQVLMAFPNMSHCRISVVLTGGAKIKNIHEPPPTLTSITLLVGTLFCIAPLNEWFSQTRNLQNLTISYATRNQDGSECRLLKRATSLISLSITITDTYIRDDGTWVEYVYDREDDTEFRNNVDLTQNRNLRTLCLDIPSSVSLATYWLNQLPAPKLLVSLLLNLSSCAVRSVFEGPSDLVDEFDSLLGSSSFSGLKEISIIDAREGSQMLEVERNRLPLLRARNLKPFP